MVVSVLQTEENPLEPYFRKCGSEFTERVVIWFQQVTGAITPILTGLLEACHHPLLLIGAIRSGHPSDLT